MRLLAICDTTQYARPPLDVPSFYRAAAQDPRIAFYHVPTQQVLAMAASTTERVPTVQTAPVHAPLPYADFLQLSRGAHQPLSLDGVDCVFCRTLKPFPAGYLAQLQRWESHTQFVNRPSGIAQQIQPDFLSQVATPFLPETLVTTDEPTAQAFLERHRVVVAKQANSCGGRGVFKVWQEDGQVQTDHLLAGRRTFASLSQAMVYLRGTTQQPLQFVRYLRRVHEGDKRIVVVDDEIYGAYLRRSKQGHWVNNVSGGGECTLATVSDDERWAIQQTALAYRRLSITTLGYDFLMDDDGTWRISEINAGNIGGFARLELLTGQPVMQRFIDWLVNTFGARSDNTLQPTGDRQLPSAVIPTPTTVPSQPTTRMPLESNASAGTTGFNRSKTPVR
ncbi:MAG: YheC/YheD family protein [Cyanobacteria bacterium J06638_20]